MSLIKCQECGNEISDKAKTCPHCGYKVKKYNKKNIVIISSLSVMVIAIIIIIYFFQNGKPSEYSVQAYNYGIDALMVADNYLDKDYDYDEAYSELGIIKNKLDILHNKDDDIDTFVLGVDVLILSSTMLNGTYSEVLDERNKLADKLNEKKR
jgi:RNA polymerase subunit RPABC4/transcription elongation factor Spt4